MSLWPTRKVSSIMAEMLLFCSLLFPVTWNNNQHRAVLQQTFTEQMNKEGSQTEPRMGIQKQCLEDYSLI